MHAEQWQLKDRAREQEKLYTTEEVTLKDQVATEWNQVGT